MEHKTLDLCLFGDGGGDGAAAGSESAQTGAADVVLGKPGPDQSETASEQQPEAPVDRSAAFDELIRGEYRDEYAKRTQQMINARFKQSKQTEERLASLQPLHDALARRYGLDANAADYAERAMQALDSDDGWMEDEADRRGMTVDQLKVDMQKDAELARLRFDVQAMRTQQQAYSTVNQWQQEANALREIYPDFNLEAESEAPAEPGQQYNKFMRLLQQGESVRDAYEFVHKDELLSGALRQAVNSARQRTVDTIRARGDRPAEAGAGSSNKAARIKSDPNDWSKAEMEEAIRQARLGKKIYL